MKRGSIELLVGIFVIVAIISFVILAFQVSGLSSNFNKKEYTVSAAFDNIGGLKVRAPVAISGVKIGEVSTIIIDQHSFQAIVSMRIFANINKIPDDTSASIYTAGLIGANYISLAPGYSETYLQEGSVIQSTQPALVLEKLVSQYLFNIKKGT